MTTQSIITQIPLELPFEPSWRMEDFMVGASNRRAFELVRAWPQWPALTALICGPEGAGKTHLLRIWSMLCDAHYIDIATTPEPELAPLIDTPKPVAIDNIHLGRDKAAQTRLFHVLNAARQNETNVLMAAVGLPDEWGFDLPDLLSRIRNAPEVRIASPDDELLEKLMLKLFADRQLFPDAAVVRALIARMERSFVAAHSLVNLTDTMALAQKRPITRALAMRALEQFDAERKAATEVHEPSLAVAPDPGNTALVRPVKGRNHLGEEVEIPVIEEKPLTLFLNAQEIVTVMTIGDYPQELAIGYLLNQNMLKVDDVIEAVDYDEDLSVVVVRTQQQTNFEDKLKKKIRTSGCAQGTVFGDIMEGLETLRFEAETQLRTSWLYALTKTINTLPSLYLAAGAIHGCVLCERDRPIAYMEDVGRHNAVDKIRGWMWQNNVDGADKIFYTTGRLTSEMVIKTALMGIPVLVSRSGFTAWGVELAQKLNLTLVGRARGQRFVALAGLERVVYDAELKNRGDISKTDDRKGRDD